LRKRRIEESSHVVWPPSVRKLVLLPSKWVDLESLSDGGGRLMKG
jgi:hypothetical protein